MGFSFEIVPFGSARIQQEWVTGSIGNLFNFNNQWFGK